MATFAAIVTMAFRILSLLLCLLLAGPMRLRAHGLARPETRVGGAPGFSSVFAAPSASQVAESHQENSPGAYDFASAVHKYLYAHDNPVNLTDPSGHYSTVRQYYGYSVEDALQDFYEEDHPGNSPILKSKGVFRVDEPRRWLFPDIYDPNTQKWLEVKPLSPAGVLSGEAKRRLNAVALPGGPDLSWISPLIVQISTGESFVTVNVAGVVYYQQEELVEKQLLTVIAAGGAMAAKDLLTHASSKAAVAAIQGSIRPVIARLGGMSTLSRSADGTRLNQHVGIASILGTMGAF